MLISFCLNYFKMPYKSIRRKRGRRKRNSEGNNDTIRETNNDNFANRHRVSFKQQGRSNINISKSLSLVSNDDFLKEVTFRNINRQITCHEIRKSMKNDALLQTIKPVKTKWYKVMILCKEEYSKNILDILRSIIREPFEPIMPKFSPKEISFYIDSRVIVNTIFLNIPMPYKEETVINVKLEYPPECQINDTFKEKIKRVIDKRYIQQTNSLNLSKFYYDSDLFTHYFCPLSRPGMMKTVLDIVHEYLPTLEALNLDDNKLDRIDKLNVLHRQFPKLRILHIRNNKIKDINQLNTIKGLQLEELRLVGNPIFNKYASKFDYIRDIRKIFPKLLRLDDMELPPLILFDIANDMKVPPTQQVFVRDAKAQDIANRFLMEYLSIFDSENKHPLLNAYDEHARFSLTIKNSKKLRVYLPEDRNLLRITNYNKRQKLLKQGRLQILSCITQLPQTKHHLNTFTMDISIVTEQMMLIELTGLFNNTLNNQLCYFSRTFIIVPRGSGYCISNEQLYISLPTEEQCKKFFANNCSIQQIANGLKQMGL